MPIQLKLVLNAVRILMIMWTSIPRDKKREFHAMLTKILTKAMEKGNGIFVYAWSKLKELSRKKNVTMDDLKAIESEIEGYDSDDMNLPYSVWKKENEEDDIDKVTSMNMLFVGGDGVLYDSELSDNDKKKYSSGDIHFIESSFVKLKEIIEETGAGIVLTAPLRKMQGGKELLEKKLEEYGLLDNLVSFTSDIQNENWKQLIKKGLKIDGFIKRFAVFGAVNEAENIYEDNMINCEEGIGEAEKKKCLELLDNEKKEDSPECS